MFQMQLIIIINNSLRIATFHKSGQFCNISKQTFYGFMIKNY